jgi:hypothetical protein
MADLCPKDVTGISVSIQFCIVSVSDGPGKPTS